MHVPFKDLKEEESYLVNTETRMITEKLMSDGTPAQPLSGVAMGGGEGPACPPDQATLRTRVANGKESGLMNERRKKFRDAISRDYEGTVLRSEVFSDPPVRGQYGYAYIPLKEGAVPTRQKPFFMHG